MATTSRKHLNSHILAIFLDLDNTLIPTRRADKQACEKVQYFLEDEYGIKRVQATSIVSKFLSSFRSTPENPQYTLDNWRLSLWGEALGSQYRGIAGDVAEQWMGWRQQLLQPDEGVIPMLQMLKSHYLLALITNGYSRFQWEKINNLHLQRYFQCILVSGDFCWEKPSKAIFMAACEQLGVRPDECIMVGDRLDTDILGAHNAGLAASVWVPCEETRTEVNVKADYVIDHVTLLPRLLPPPRRPLNRYLNLSEPESENSNSSETS